MSVNLPGVRMANNQGLFALTGGNDLIHVLSIGRKAVIRKIMCYNNTGANVTLQFGTLTAVPAFVALLPIFVAIDTLDNQWTEEEIPYFEFVLNTSAGAAGRVGDIYCLAGAATPTLWLEVEEMGA